MDRRVRIGRLPDPYDLARRVAVVVDQWEDRELGERMADEVIRGLRSPLMARATAQAMNELARKELEGRVDTTHGMIHLLRGDNYDLQARADADASKLEELARERDVAIAERDEAQDAKRRLKHVLAVVSEIEIITRHVQDRGVTAARGIKQIATCCQILKGREAADATRERDAAIAGRDTLRECARDLCEAVERWTGHGNYPEDSVLVGDIREAAAVLRDALDGRL